jgi:hypothetical protein
MHICVKVLRSHHLVNMVSIVRVENTMNCGRSGARVLHQVGCQWVFLSRQTRHMKFGILTVSSIVVAFIRYLTHCSLKQRNSRPTSVSEEPPVSLFNTE